jgi:hypothetical protein
MKLHLLIHSYSVDSEFYTRLEPIIIFCAFFKIMLRPRPGSTKIEHHGEPLRNRNRLGLLLFLSGCHVASPSSDRLPLLCSGRLEA